MNPKILEILPKKQINTCKREMLTDYAHGFTDGCNFMLDEVTEALKNNDVCVCPSEEELISLIHISDLCKEANANTDWQIRRQRKQDLAKAIRKLILEGV